MSFSFSTTYCFSFCPSKSTPLYFWYSTVSPLLRVGFTTSPFSFALPLPTATTCRCAPHSHSIVSEQRMHSGARPQYSNARGRTLLTRHLHMAETRHVPTAHQGNKLVLQCRQSAHSHTSMQALHTVKGWICVPCQVLASLCWSLPSTSRPLWCLLHLQSADRTLSTRQACSCTVVQ